MSEATATKEQQIHKNLAVFFQVIANRNFYFPIHTVSLPIS